jgi:hydrogenase-4 component E
MPALPLSSQFINLLAALLLLLAFAMLTQRRILSLINLFALQGFVLGLATLVVGYSTGQPHLYLSAVITFALKVLLLPWFLHWLIRKLNVQWDIEAVINIPVQMLVGIVLVIFAFNLAAPISQIAGTFTRSTLGIATATILLSFLMMISRRKAVSQVIGFLAMENGLFFAATSTTYGMPMVVELGILFDVLVATLIFGVFFFHIRETFESLDIHHLEKLKEPRPQRADAEAQRRALPHA